LIGSGDKRQRQISIGSVDLIVAVEVSGRKRSGGNRPQGGMIVASRVACQAKFKSFFSNRSHDAVSKPLSIGS